MAVARAPAQTPARAPEHLPVGAAELLREEGVDDGVDGEVAVGQAVRRHAEVEGRLGEREGAELHPQVEHVVRQPGEAEHHHHHQHRLGRLRDGRGGGGCDVMQGEKD